MAKYFSKEIPSNPIHFSIGRAIPFEHVDYDYGYYATDNGWEIEELSKAALNHVGGVTEITEAEYGEFLKKKAVAPPLRPLQAQRQQLGFRSKQSGPSRVADLAGTSLKGSSIENATTTGVVKPQKVEGLKVDREFVKPRTGKIPHVT